MEDHLLKKVWGDYSFLFNNDLQVTVNTTQIEKIIADMMSVGRFYHYLIDIKGGTISNCSSNILEMHGLQAPPQYLKEIIELIHPDDIPFVMAAERMTIEKFIEIGMGSIQNLKSSYCFRMRTSKGYEMFHHQAIHTLISDEGLLLQAINIHTNIQHLTPVNSYTVLVSGIGDRNDFHQMSYKNNLLKDALPESLTNREREILKHIASGHTSEEIARIFTISNHTIRTHRKNILRKTQTKNSSELIKKCVEWGLI
ncbi:MAG: helix-turn-helix transcriptional regulator [Pseudopedobacter saltans]|uniref:Helix-turn-helix transcriptional regulator n=1 Tax=Pseudopedobacter saltans TaxID=151895 RepID=A0A2W5HDS1_9SPHI|nr:MAG: helix-turn-helix transcriptional regulator [Pseudopedobacter saltans]